MIEEEPNPMILILLIFVLLAVALILWVFSMVAVPLFITMVIAKSLSLYRAKPSSTEVMPWE